MPDVSGPALLRAEGIEKHYPGTIALSGVDLEVNPGEVIALLGENGAGKSTLAKIIAGVESVTSGTMALDNRRYAPTSPLEAMSAGIGMIHQEMQLLPDLTVAENVFIGRWLTGPTGNIDRGAMAQRAQEQLRRLGFTRPMNTLVRDLSVAGQQQVEIARALLLNARILILDEPTAALGDEETQALFRCVRELQKEGVAFIYVSHRLAEIAQIATRIVVLRDGALVATHDNATIHPDQLVAEMVGRTVERLFPEMPPPSHEVVLEVANINAANNIVRDISFNVRAGEIFGIAGLVGAGRTELVRAISGADPTASGMVTIHGTGLRPHSVNDAIKNGLVMVPEDRKGQGLLLDMSIQENVGIANFDRLLVTGGWLSDSRGLSITREVISSMGVKGDSSKKVSQLSGGNQQKVVIGKWVSRSPRVVILDEPTRGIDVGARAAIYDVIADLARQGVAIIVVSSDLEEVIGLSHRIMVLSRGQMRAILDRDEADGEKIISLAAH